MQAFKTERERRLIQPLPKGMIGFTQKYEKMIYKKCSFVKNFIMNIMKKVMAIIKKTMR